MPNIDLIIEKNLLIVFLLLTSFVFILLIWNIFIQVNLSRFKKRNEELFSGNKVKNIEELLLAQSQNLKTLDRDIQELFNISNQINTLAFRGFHKMGMVRFNPFKDVGGDQSFAIALLDGKNNGLTISSLYTREGTRIYSKSISAGKSEKYPLTEEEKEALEIAIKNIKKEPKG
ncbi:MAG TPA: DUF4446 family protein [Candidatus Moranbacteria bacterium]|nr:DUF4446 family protein [Candidatus Moranbacteria bacterium]